MQKLKLLLTYSPPFICLLLLLPRIGSAQFGLLDDGVTISTARQLLAGDINGVLLADQGLGRSRPLYWLYNAFVYFWAGTNPTGFFTANCIVFVVVTVVLIALTYRWTSSYLQAFAAGLFFAASIPAIETVYTLSKAELFQVLLLLISLMLFQAHTGRSKSGQILVAVGMVLVLLAAMLTKETAVVMVPISLGWLLIGLVRKGLDEQICLQNRVAYVTSALVALGIFVLFRFLFVSLDVAAGSYTSGYALSLPRLAVNGLYLTAFVVQGYAYLIPLCVAFVFLEYVWLDPRRKTLLFDTLIWIFGWGLIFVPWTTMQWYYMLPFAVGCAVLGAILFGQVLSALQSPRVRLDRWVGGISIVVALILAWVPLLNALSNMRMQLAVDRTNAQVVDWLATLPPGSRLFVNLPQGSEYVYELGTHLALLKHRPDIRVDYVNLDRLHDQIPSDAYFALPYIENRVYPSFRIGVDWVESSTQNQSLLDSLKGRLALAFDLEDRSQVYDTGWLWCQFRQSERCQFLNSWLETSDFVYGWEIFRVVN